MIDTDRQLKPAPLSFDKPESQVAKINCLVELVTASDGTRIEVPKVNRKTRRHADAYDRRKFKPATRPMNQRELREFYLNKYEESLYKPRHQQSQPRKPQTEAKPENDLPALPLGRNRQARIARRNEVARRAAMLLQEPLTPQIEASPLEVAA